MGGLGLGLLGGRGVKEAVVARAVNGGGLLPGPLGVQRRRIVGVGGQLGEAAVVGADAHHPADGAGLDLAVGFHHLGPDATAVGHAQAHPLVDLGLQAEAGVGAPEICYLFGMYKKLKNEFTGVLTGKSLNWGGSLIRPVSGCPPLHR